MKFIFLAVNIPGQNPTFAPDAIDAGCGGMDLSRLILMDTMPPCH